MEWPIGIDRLNASECGMNRQNEWQSSAGSKPNEAGGDRSVAVVGAGLSGLACARELADRGADVRVFDKARGPGGRMATRRAGDRRFDHGAQYFTVRDERFEEAVETWSQLGIVAPWTGRVVVMENGAVSRESSPNQRYVGVPGMNAVCRHLARDLDVTYGTRVESLNRDDGGWTLKDGAGVHLGRFGAVVVSAPAPQAAALVGAVSPHLALKAGAVTMSPCWAVMMSFPGSLGLDFDGAFVKDSAISWMARDASKPQRPDLESWVVHASPEWSMHYLEVEHHEAAKRLEQEFRDQVGLSGMIPSDAAAHRWRFALPLNPLSVACLFDAPHRLVLCGDWCGGPRVEGAFRSGIAAAERLLESS
jgi:predicted NAD/FAD-dependent oxidoreductase